MSSVRILTAVLASWLFLAAWPAHAQDSIKSEDRKVTATATATTFVRPDSARLTFVIATAEAADKSAREANEKQVKKVKDALKAVTLGKLDVEVSVLPTTTGTLGISPETPGGARPVVGKLAQTVFEVVVREKDVDKLQDAVRRLAEAASDNGATGPDNDDRSTLSRLRLPRRPGVPEEPEPIAGPTIEWVAAEVDEARHDAIKRATKEALANAQAAVGDAKLKVLEIKVSTLDDAPTRFRLLGQTNLAGAARIPVRAMVDVICSY
jgi:uncharacterized protein YggE